MTAYPIPMRGHRSASILTRNAMSNFLKRGRKTSRDQVEMYVDFLEENPAVAMARSNPTNDCVINSLWEELTSRLNSSEQGPLKSLQQWQETFANWRYQLRFKTRKLLTQLPDDGLGLMELGDLEERALRVFTNDAINEAEPIQNNYPPSHNPSMPRRKFTRKRIRSTISSPDRRITRNSISVDSTSSQIYEKQLDCEANPFYEYFEHEQKPLIIHEPVAFPAKAETAVQTDQQVNGVDFPEKQTADGADIQVEAINRLERAVNSLNDTLTRLVQVQSDILSTMNRR